MECPLHAQSSVLFLIWFMIGSLVCIVGAALHSQAAVAATVLKVSHQFAAGDVRDEMIHVLGDRITERTKGAIKFRYYPAGSLFKAKEQWDALLGNLSCPVHRRHRHHAHLVGLVRLFPALRGAQVHQCAAGLRHLVYGGEHHHVQ